jgi:hypothetical protein
MDFLNNFREVDQQAWEEEFAAVARRPLPVRLRYAFVRTYKPILDDVPYRLSSAWTIIGVGVKHNCHPG